MITGLQLLQRVARLVEILRAVSQAGSVDTSFQLGASRHEQNPTELHIHIADSVLHFSDIQRRITGQDHTLRGIALPRDGQVAEEGVEGGVRLDT